MQLTLDHANLFVVLATVCCSVLQRVAACCNVSYTINFWRMSTCSTYVSSLLNSLCTIPTQFTTYKYDSIHYTNLLLNLLRTNTTPFTIQICYSIHYITPTFTIQICYSIYYVQIRLHSQYKFATQFTI